MTRRLAPIVTSNQVTVSCSPSPSGRELGIPFPGQAGPTNSITDVAGVAVGQVTLIEGEGKLVPGKGPIRTGVTAILPRPRGNWDPVATIDATEEAVVNAMLAALRKYNQMK